mmetsp:Transcript_14214/g.42322  ORF Transcript_14214/g.42322 Transcript_14214/m.42322 type:complete len:252 (+) Transcript_14214:246-1001(+)
MGTAALGRRRPGCVRLLRRRGAQAGAAEEDRSRCGPLCGVPGRRRNEARAAHHRYGRGLARHNLRAPAPRLRQRGGRSETRSRGHPRNAVAAPLVACIDWGRHVHAPGRRRDRAGTASFWNRRSCCLRCATRRGARSGPGPGSEPALQPQVGDVTEGTCAIPDVALGLCGCKGGVAEDASARGPCCRLDLLRRGRAQRGKAAGAVGLGLDGGLAECASVCGRRGAHALPRRGGSQEGPGGPPAGRAHVGDL